MAEKNWMLNPHLHDSDYNASTPDANIPDGCLYSHWVGTPKSRVYLAAETNLFGLNLANLWETEYTFLTGETGNNYVNIGMTAVGSFKTTVVDSITPGTPSIIHTTTAHGLLAGDAVYLSGTSADASHYVTQVDDSQTFRVAANISLTGTGRCSPIAYGRALLNWYSSDPAVTARMYMVGKDSSGNTVGSATTGSLIAQNWGSAPVWSQVNLGGIHNDSVDRIQMDFIFQNCINVGTLVKVRLGYPNIVKRNGVRDWISGVYGGSWVGSAHNSETTEVAAVINNADKAVVGVGEEVTLTGSGFGDIMDAGEVAAKVDGIDVTEYAEWTPTSITLTIPNSVTSGAKLISVEPKTGGGSDPADWPITIGAAAITAVTPDTDFYPGSRITIDGSGFSSGGTVTVGGVAATSVISWSDTRVVCRIPRVHIGARNVVVIPSGKAATPGHSITIVAAPFLVRHSGQDKPFSKLKVKSGGSWIYPTAMFVHMDNEDWEVGFSTGGTDPPPPTEDFIWPVGNSISAANITTVTALQQLIDNEANPGDTIVLPNRIITDGATATPTLTLPDYVNIWGKGIWKQSDAASGGGGSWVKARFVWGSYCHVHGVLFGFNIAGKQCNHNPIPRDTTRTDCDWTSNHGCTHPVFTNCRFKGGADGGDGSSAIIQLGSNYRRGFVSTETGKMDMIDHRWYDCEFERVQAINAVLIDGTFKTGNPGSWFNGWWDCRPNGSWVKGNRFVRCHMGVRNGYHAGVDGYGIGSTTLLQPSPTGPSTSAKYTPNWTGYLCNPSDLPATGAVVPGSKERWTHPDCGPSTDGGSSIALYYPRLTDDPPYGGYGYQPAGSPLPLHTGNWNPNFDFSNIDHGAEDNQFIDCLFEYATWHPMNPCDFARNYSTWQGCLAKDYTGNTFWDANGNAYSPPGQTGGSGGAIGWGNPPGKNWTQIPASHWNKGFSALRCMSKAPMMGSNNMVGEISRDCIVEETYGLGHNQAAKPYFQYGNVVRNARTTLPMPKPSLPTEATALGVKSVFSADWSGTGYSAISPYDPNDPTP